MEQNSENKFSTSMANDHSDGTINGLKQLIALDTVSSSKESLESIVKDAGHQFKDLNQTQLLQVANSKIAKQLQEMDAENFDDYMNSITKGKFSKDFDEAKNNIGTNNNYLASKYNIEQNQPNASGGFQNFKNLLDSLSDDELKEVGKFVGKLAVKASIVGLVGAMSGVAGPAFVVLALKQAISHVAFKELAATGIVDAIAIRASQNVAKLAEKIKEPNLKDGTGNLKKVAFVGAIAALTLASGAAMASTETGLSAIKEGIEVGVNDFKPVNSLNIGGLENAESNINVKWTNDGNEAPTESAISNEIKTPTEVKAESPAANVETPAFTINGIEVDEATWNEMKDVAQEDLPQYLQSDRSGIMNFDKGEIPTDTSDTPEASDVNAELQTADTPEAERNSFSEFISDVKEKATDAVDSIQNVLNGDSSETPEVEKPEAQTTTDKSDYVPPTTSVNTESFATVGVLKPDEMNTEPPAYKSAGFTADLMNGATQKMAEDIPSLAVETPDVEVPFKSGFEIEATVESPQKPETHLSDTVGVMAPSDVPEDAPTFSQSILGGAQTHIEKDLTTFAEPETPDINVPERPEGAEVNADDLVEEAEPNEVVADFQTPEFEEVVVEKGDSLWKLLGEQLDADGIEFESEGKKNAAIVEIINKHYSGMENVHMIKSGANFNIVSYDSIEQLRHDLEGVDLSNNVLETKQDLGDSISKTVDKAPEVSQGTVDNKHTSKVEVVGDKQSSQPKENVNDIESDINAFDNNSKNMAQAVTEAASVSATSSIQVPDSSPLSQFGVGKAWDQLGVGELALEKVVVNHQSGQTSYFAKQQDFADLISKSGVQLSEAEQDWLVRGFEAKINEHEKLNGAADKGFSYVANVSKASIENLLTDYPIGYGSEYSARVAAMNSDIVIRFDPETADLVAPKGVEMTASQFAAQIVANKVQSGEIDPLGGEISNKITEIAYKLKLANPEGTTFNSLNLPQEMIKQSTHGIEEVGIFSSSIENDDDELNSFADKVTKTISPLSADVTAFTSNVEYMNKLNEMPSVDSSPIFYEVIENVVHSGGKPISLDDYTDAIIKAQIEGKLVDTTQIDLAEHKADMLELLQKSNPNIGDGDLVTQIEVPAILAGEKNLPLREMGLFDDRVAYSHVKVAELSTSTPTNKISRSRMDF